MVTVPTGRLRPIALAIIRDGDRILVFEGFDPSKGERFYRPLGGGIEFGERGGTALARELREELGAEVTTPRYLATMENIFVYDGKPGHEICLLYETQFVDRHFYALEVLEGREADGSAYRAYWKRLADFADGPYPLYPEGLLALLSPS